MKSAFEVVCEAIEFQALNNTGNPPDLTPVLQQHGWDTAEFFAAYLQYNPGTSP